MARETLRIATWNCFGMPQTALDFLAGRPFWPERLDAPEVVRELASFDVVCVQENLVERVTTALENVRREAGFASLWFDPHGAEWQRATLVGGGLAILSRHPMKARFEKLPRGKGPDGFARKGYAVAEIELPTGRRLRVVNTHLQADDSLVSKGASRDARGEQLESLGAALRALETDATPVVVCGDFNVAHHTTEYATLRRAVGDRFTDLAADAGLLTYDVAENDLAAEFHRAGPERALFDYVFVERDRARPVEVEKILDEPIAGRDRAPASYSRARGFSSDHFGVGATLDLEW